MTNPFLKLDFLFEFCFSLHGMQYVLLSHTGKYYFNFSGSMVPNFHGTAEFFFLCINRALMLVTIHAKY